MVQVKVDKEPSKENYVNILRGGNELLRLKESKGSEVVKNNQPNSDSIESERKGK